MTKELELIAEETEISLGSALVIWNDDYNTFGWVIKCLVEILNHHAAQAEQCAYIIHYKGKYAAKQGEESALKPLKDALIDRGLNVTIEKV
jgi:ATP-dependent Clp protease adaptor protein ClpS